jgi:quercetin dioxygenase-like cupin family protein
MVSVGDEMVNPRSGERFVWRATRASTDGAYCEFELHLSPGAKVAAPHRHPNQEERFTTVSGSIRLVRGGETILCGPGDETVIPPGTPHKWGNNDESSSFTIVRLTPALHIEEFFEVFCRLASEGKASASGLPRNPLQLAVVLDAYREEFAFATPAQQTVLSPLLTVFAAIGRRLRFQGTVG